MSKKLWVLIILLGIIGVAIGLYIDFNPITTIQNLIQNPTSIIEWIKGIPLALWLSIGSAIGGVVTAIAVLTRNVTQYKQQTQQNVNQIKSDSATAINKLSIEKQEAETQLTETTKTYSENLKTISENYAKTQEQLQDITASTKQLEAERNYLAQKVKELEAKPFSVSS